MLALTEEAMVELLICLDMIGMFGALESASKLLPSEEPWTAALPAMLEILLLICDDCITKAGNYIQSNSDSSSIGALVKFYALSVSHS